VPLEEKKEEGRNAADQSESPLQEHGKTLVFKPATCRGFQNGADIEPQLVHPGRDRVLSVHFLPNPDAGGWTVRHHPYQMQGLDGETPP